MKWLDLIRYPTTFFSIVAGVATALPLIDGLPGWAITAARVAAAVSIAIVGFNAQDVKDSQ